MCALNKQADKNQTPKVIYKITSLVAIEYEK